MIKLHPARIFWKFDTSSNINPAFNTTLWNTIRSSLEAQVCAHSTPATHHDAAAQAEVLKLWAEVQDTEQGCLLPQGNASEGNMERETKRRGQLSIKGCHCISWNTAQNSVTDTTNAT